MDKRRQLHPIVSGLSTLLCLWALGACGRPFPPVHTPPAPEIIREIPAKKAPEPSSYVHTVRWTTETLSLIARWYTGSASNWPVIARNNPTLDPNRLAIGDVVSIPLDKMTTDRPMPRSFLPVPTPQARRVPPPSPPVAEELFGPMDAPPLADDDDDLFPPMR
jgi:hypothetical protein